MHSHVHSFLCYFYFYFCLYSSNISTAVLTSRHKKGFTADGKTKLLLRVFTHGFTFYNQLMQQVTTFVLAEYW